MESPKGAYIRFGTGWSVASGTLAQRFPSFFNASAGVGLLTKRSWIYAAEVEPLFGSVVRAPGLFDGILGPSNYLIDQNGNISLIRFYMRGYAIKAGIGKVFANKSKYDHTGLVLRAGVGFIQHRIKMRFDSDQVPQLEREYGKGYDRLTNGILFYQTIGYQLVNAQGLSFMIGADLNQGFTKNRRSWNYSEMKADQSLRNDLYLNFHASLLIPIFKTSGSKETFFE